MIEIFSTRELEEFDEVLKYGLRSKRRLILDRVIEEDEQILHEFEEWRKRLIYFGLDEPTKETAWFSILVDENTVNVGNMNLEYSYDSYRQSIMSLSKYLEKRTGGGGGYSHPLSAERIRKRRVMKFQNVHKLLRYGENDYLLRNEYDPEVFIETDHIARFHRFNRGQNIEQ